MVRAVSRRVSKLGLHGRRRFLPRTAGRRFDSRGGLSESGSFTSEAIQRRSAGIGADSEAEQAEDSERGNAARGAAGQFFEKGGDFLEFRIKGRFCREWRFWRRRRRRRR